MLGVTYYSTKGISNSNRFIDIDNFNIMIYNAFVTQYCASLLKGKIFSFLASQEFIND